MRFSIDAQQAFARGALALGAASKATRQQSTSRKGRLVVTGLAVWAVSGTLQPAPQSAVAAPPAHRHAPADWLPAPQHLSPQHLSPQGHASQHHASHSHGAFAYESSPYGSSVSAANHSGGCSICGKKRRSLVRKFLDGVTAGTDRLIFGSCYQDTCDCDARGDTACDAGCDTACDAIGFMPLPASHELYYSPRPAGPGLDLLPAPSHHPPVPPRDGMPDQLSPEHPTSKTNRDLQLNPFGDDPIYQGTNPAISRSAYYE